MDRRLGSCWGLEGGDRGRAGEEALVQKTTSRTRTPPHLGSRDRRGEDVRDIPEAWQHAIWGWGPVSPLLPLEVPPWPLKTPCSGSVVRG
jgi:hypothetical protein